MTPCILCLFWPVGALREERPRGLETGDLASNNRNPGETPAECPQLAEVIGVRRPERRGAFSRGLCCKYWGQEMHVSFGGHYFSGQMSRKCLPLQCKGTLQE